MADDIGPACPVPIKLLLSVREVAKALGMSERTVWRLAATGDIPPPLAIGRSRRWSRSTLEAWLAREERRAQCQQKASMPT